MRKGVMIAGALVVVGAVGGLAVMQWAQSRATAEVERTFAALRATGATVEHKPPMLDIWSRSVRIDDIKIGLGGDTSKAMTISSVKADGLSLFSSDLQSARVDVTGIAIERTLQDRPDWSFTFKIPVVTIEKLSLPKTSPAVSGTANPLAATGSYLQAIKAASIAAETIETSVTLPLPPPPPGRFQTARPPQGPLRYVYEKVRLDRIGDGRIAQASTGKSNFTGPTGSGSIDSLNIEDIDLLPLFRTGLDLRKATDGYYQIQGKQTVGRMALKTPEGLEISFAGMTGSGFGIDPAKVSIQAVLDLIAMAGSPGTPPTPAAMASMMTAVGNLYEGIRIDDFRMLDMQTSIPGALPGSKLAIASMSLGGLIHGKLDRLQIDEVAMASPAIRPGLPNASAQQFSLGRFALKGFDIAGLMRTAGAFSQPMRPGQPPPNPMQILALLEGFELRNMQVPDFGTGEVRIDDMTLAWGRFTAGMPADARWTFKGLVPVNPRDPSMQPLIQKGIRKLALELDTASSYSPDTFEISMSPIRIKLEHFGTLTGNVVLGSVTPSSYAMMASQYTLVVPQFTLKNLDLKLEDAGIIANFYQPSIAPSPSGLTPPNPMTALREQLLDPTKPPGNLGAILDALTRFLEQPGQTFALRLDANSAVRLVEIMEASPATVPGALARTFEKFSVDVRVGK